MVTNEPDWPEGPMPWGITIRNNRFVRGGKGLGYADALTRMVGFLRLMRMAQLAPPNVGKSLGIACTFAFT